MPRIDAIDISHWNSVSSFQALVDDGVIGVFQKCTEGTSYVDDTYASRMPQALGVGLRWGAYHFLKHGNIQAQMDHFISQAKLAPRSRVAIDYEDVNCTLDDLHQSLDAVKYLDDTLQICVYAGGLLKGQVGDKYHDWLKPFPLWLAQYTTGQPSWPRQIWDTWTLWQYTDSGEIDGVDGACDLNTFNGTPENCDAWFGPAAPVPVPTPLPPTQVVEPVIVDVIAPDGVKVVVSINGRRRLERFYDHMMRGGEE